MPYLIVKYQGRKLKTFRLNPDGGKARIGRDEKNEITIDDTAVSTLHAEIEPEGEHFYLTDFNSRNGTFVNKELVISRRLSHGDVISMGKHTLLFAYGKDEKRPAEYEQGSYQATMQMDTEEHRARLAKSVAGFAEQEEKKVFSALLSFLSRQQEPMRLDKEGIVIGKDRQCDIRVRGLFVGKKEARIEKRNDGYYLCPLSARPRIKLNYKPVKTAVKLQEFDVIESGDIM
ncbi:MAG: FHA domain-containing protein, partial [Desulfosalsimonas sp.]